MRVIGGAPTKQPTRTLWADDEGSAKSKKSAVSNGGVSIRMTASKSKSKPESAAPKPKSSSSKSLKFFYEAPASPVLPERRPAVGLPERFGNAAAQKDKARDNAFMVCGSSAETQALRAGYSALDTVLLNNKTGLKPAQVAALVKFIRAHGLDEEDAFVTYDGMAKIADVLCRWPRPAELGKVARTLGRVIKYRVTRVPFVANVPIGLIAGRLGGNLIRLTRGHDLMYAWIKKNGQGVTTLYLYSLNMAADAEGRLRIVGEKEMDTTTLDAALDAFFSMTYTQKKTTQLMASRARDAGGKLKPVSHTIRTLGPESPKFVGQK